MSDRSSCPVEPEDLSAFMDEELPGERMDELREHVRDCERCGERLSRLREAQRIARTVDAPPAPDSFVQDVRERVREETTGEGSVEPDQPSIASRDRPDPSDESVADASRNTVFDHPVGLAAAALLLVGISVGLVAVFQQTSERSANQVAMEKESAERDVQFSSDSAGTTSDSEDRADTPKKAAASVSESSESKTSDAESAEEQPDEATSGGGAGSGSGGGSLGQKTEERSLSKAKKKSKEPDDDDTRAAKGSRGTAGQFAETMDQKDPALSPVLVRLRGDRKAVLDELTGALSALDSERVELRALLPAETNGGADSSEGDSAPEDREAWSTGDVRTLSLDVSPERLAGLLDRNAKLELVTRENEAKLLLGALVQQGQSPAVLSTEPEKFGGVSQFAVQETYEDRPEEQETDAPEKQASGGEKRQSGQTVDPIRRAVTSLQHLNMLLQRSRAEFVEQSTGADSTNAASGEAISTATLRRFLRRFERKREGKTEEGETIADKAVRTEGQKEPSPADHASERRNALQKWVTYLEKRPSSWLAEEEDEARQQALQKQFEANQENDGSRRNRGLNQNHVDVHLRIHGAVTPAAETPERRMEERREDE